MSQFSSNAQKIRKSYDSRVFFFNKNLFDCVWRIFVFLIVYEKMCYLQGWNFFLQMYPFANETQQKCDTVKYLKCSFVFKSNVDVLVGTFEYDDVSGKK